MLLDLKDITVHYGTAEAVTGVTLGVEERCVVSIIGANGSGKSTILKAISGLIPLVNGEISFLQKRIDGLAPHKIVELGISHVPEGRKPFPYMNVLANLKLGAFLRKDKAGIESDLEMIFEIFPKLKDRLKQKAGTLSGGEQQMLAIGRGLMARPKLLQLDEPSLGLSPLLVDEIANVIKDIHARGMSVLLVEQNASLVTKVADKAYVLEVGKVVLEGDMRKLMTNKLVQRAFLGE
jgi:branched-chain amino acid transport system ATP-binding protein